MSLESKTKSNNKCLAWISQKRLKAKINSELLKFRLICSLIFV